MFSSTAEIMRIAKDTAKLSVEQHDFELPVVKATAGPDAVLISKLRNDDFVMLDPGFLTTAQCESKITFIDGDSSILRYRGYPIEQLVEHSTFLEVAFLLIYGFLPTAEQRDAFISDVNHRTMVGEDFRTFLGSFPKSAHPMAMLASSVSALETFADHKFEVHNPGIVDEAAKMIMAKVRTITSFLHRRRRNQPLLYADYSRGYVDDFMRMCFSVPYEHFDSNPLFVEAIDKLLILQADHEQNCSTSAMRITASADASLYASIASGIAALSGPLHGGANEAALRQLEEIRNYSATTGKSVRDFVEDAKNSGRKLSGFGHRVYKSYDPRAAIAKDYAKKIHAQGVGQLDLFEIALELEGIVMVDEYFVSRNLYPNIDFWTCIIYHTIGFDSEMFTALFAMARIPGWIAHWREMHDDPMHKIGRPRQVYTGNVYREWVPDQERTLAFNDNEYKEIG